MLLSTLLLCAPALAQVDLVLGPDIQFTSVGSTVEVTLTAAASSPPTSESLTAIDALLSWDPLQLDLIDATDGAAWFQSGFFTDPDGINLDVQDGEALYTVLTTPGVPATVPPDILVVTFRFTVLQAGQVSLSPSAGAFATTRVLGTAPGQEITGDISATATVNLSGTAFCNSLPNSTGSEAILTAVGDPNGSLVLTSFPVPNTLGQFYYGPQMLGGGSFLGDGIRCVGGMTQRILPFINSGMMMQLPNTATLAISYTAPYAAGLTGTQYFQHWFRSGLATGTGSNSSSGIAVTF